MYRGLALRSVQRGATTVATAGCSCSSSSSAVTPSNAGNSSSSEAAVAVSTTTTPSTSPASFCNNNSGRSGSRCGCFSSTRVLLAFESRSAANAASAAKMKSNLESSSISGTTGDGSGSSSISQSRSNYHSNGGSSGSSSGSDSNNINASNPTFVAAIKEWRRLSELSLKNPTCSLRDEFLKSLAPFEKEPLIITNVYKQLNSKFCCALLEAAAAILPLPQTNSVPSAFRDFDDPMLHQPLQVLPTLITQALDFMHNERVSRPDAQEHPRVVTDNIVALYAKVRLLSKFVLSPEMLESMMMLAKNSSSSSSSTSSGSRSDGGSSGHVSSSYEAAISRSNNSKGLTAMSSSSSASAQFPQLDLLHHQLSSSSSMASSSSSSSSSSAAPATTTTTSGSTTSGTHNITMSVSAKELRMLSPDLLAQGALTCATQGRFAFNVSEGCVLRLGPILGSVSLQHLAMFAAFVCDPAFASISGGERVMNGLKKALSQKLARVGAENAGGSQPAVIVSILASLLRDPISVSTSSSDASLSSSTPSTPGAGEQKSASAASSTAAAVSSSITSTISDTVDVIKQYCHALELSTVASPRCCLEIVRALAEVADHPEFSRIEELKTAVGTFMSNLTEEELTAEGDIYCTLEMYRLLTLESSRAMIRSNEVLSEAVERLVVQTVHSTLVDKCVEKLSQKKQASSSSADDGSNADGIFQHYVQMNSRNDFLSPETVAWSYAVPLLNGLSQESAALEKQLYKLKQQQQQNIQPQSQQNDVSGGAVSSGEDGATTTTSTSTTAAGEEECNINSDESLTSKIINELEKQWQNVETKLSVASSAFLEAASARHTKLLHPPSSSQKHEGGGDDSSSSTGKVVAAPPPLLPNVGVPPPPKTTSANVAAAGRTTSTSYDPCMAPRLAALLAVPALLKQKKLQSLVSQVTASPSCPVGHLLLILEVLSRVNTPEARQLARAMAPASAVVQGCTVKEVIQLAHYYGAMRVRDESLCQALIARSSALRDDMSAEELGCFFFALARMDERSAKPYVEFTQRVRAVSASASASAATAIIVAYARAAVVWNYSLYFRLCERIVEIRSSWSRRDMLPLLLALLRLEMRHDKLIEIVTTELMRAPPESLSTDECVRFLSCLTRLDPATTPVVGKLGKIFLDRKNELTVNQIGDIMSSLGRAHDKNNAEAREIFEGLVLNAIAVAPTAPPVAIAAMLTGFSSMKYPQKEIFSILAERVLQIKAECPALVISQVLSAFANVGLRDDKLFVEMIPRVRYVAHHGSAQDVASVLTAYTTVQLWHYKLFVRLAERAIAVRAECRPSHIAQILAAFAKVGMKYDKLFVELSPRIQTIAGTASAADVASIIHSYAAMNLYDAPVFSQLADRAVQIESQFTPEQAKHQILWAFDKLKIQHDPLRKAMQPLAEKCPASTEEEKQEGSEAEGEQQQ